MPIPKLELMVTVIGAHLLKHLKSNLKFQQAMIWSDSQIVLSWLKSTKQLPTRTERMRV